MNKKLAASLICSTVFGGGVTWLARSARSPQRDFRALCDVARRLAADPEHQRMKRLPMYSRTAQEISDAIRSAEVRRFFQTLAKLPTEERLPKYRDFTGWMMGGWRCPELEDLLLRRAEGP